MFNTLKYQYYLFISLSFAVLIILLATNVIFYFYTESIIEKNIVQNKLQTTQKVREQLDGLLNEMNNISISVNASNYIQEVLRNIPYYRNENFFDNEPQVGKDVRDALYSITSLQPIKGSIVILSRYMDYISLGHDMNNNSMDKEEIASVPGVPELMQTNRISMDHNIMLPHKDRWFEDGKSVISLIRPIRDNFNVYGLIEISYDLDYFEQLLAFDKSSSGAGFIVLDKRNNVVMNRLGEDTGLTESDFFNSDIFNQPTGNIELIGSNDSTYVVTYAQTAKEDWVIAMVEDISVYKRPIIVLRNTTISIYVLSVIITLVFLYIYTLGITRPIRQLKRSILDLNAQDLSRFVYKSSTNNEIMLLGQAFQKLLDEIQTHIKRTEQAHQNEMTANMAALQAQINPHFLYNTLSVISAHALMRGNHDVVEMSTALSEMFRYVTKQDSKQTLISKEIEHVQNYLLLMERRYEGLFQYDIHLDSKAGLVQVPKLVLQPFVENMFQHAFANRKPPWFIQVKATLSGRNWCIEFIDNGAGFTEQTIERFYERIEKFKTTGEMVKAEQESEGIGVVNAFARLYLMNPEDAFISLKNREDAEGGAIIRIGGSWDYVSSSAD